MVKEEKMRYKNIFGKTINVNGKKRKNDEIFNEKETQELINLVQYGYLKVMKG